MRILKKIFYWTAGVIIVLYIAVCAFFYAKQDDILFIPTKLAPNYEFSFPGNFSEYDMKTPDGVLLSGLLFKADSSKGLIFYLHGNAGSLASWGDIARIYTRMGCDVYILDYRGYGKSTGKITNEAALYNDVQVAYNGMKAMYPEDKITVIGYSIGTGPAAMLAANNKPARLILQAPYYSMTDMMKHTYGFLPTFMLKYPLNTYQFVQKAACPIVIFHGNADEVIYYGSSVKLKQYFKPGDTLITLNGAGHNGMSKNPQYLAEIKKILVKE